MPTLNVSLSPLATERSPNSWGVYEPFRSIINTYFSMIGSVVGALITNAVQGNGRLIMNNIMVTSLSGGVAAAGFSTFNNYPFSSIIIGLIVGGFSSFLYFYLKSTLIKNKAYDNFGTIFVYAIPGLIGSIMATIIISGFKIDDNNLMD